MKHKPWPYALIALAALAILLSAFLLLRPSVSPHPGPSTPSPSVPPPTAASVSPPPTLPGSSETSTPSPVTSSDDVPMVRIPAGEFIAGSRFDDVMQFQRQWNDWASANRVSGPYPDFSNEMAQRTVYLDEFYIDQYEVTNARYRRCVEAGGCNPPESLYYDDAAYADSPVVGVTWHDADAFCRWAGKRLPAEMEWEKAARGTDGRLWPWGNEWNENIYDGWQEHTPVGSFPGDASPYGVMDMADSVSEWTADWYLPYPGTLYTSEDFGQIFKVVRGGARPDALGLLVRTALRRYLAPGERGMTGFRCVQGGNAPTPQPTYTPGPTSTPDLAARAARDMVLVPAGEFVMGDNGGNPDAQPEHVVYLDAFHIDRYEVTNAQYVAFLNEIGQNWRACGGVDCASVSYGEGDSLYYENGQFKVTAGRENLPADFVSWYGADAYCRHYGMRLPTEAEWEKAARGTDGRRWPWGNEWDPDKVATAGDGPENPLPVGSRPEGASPYGVLDMIGNVAEWTNDWYAADYYARSPYRNPPGPDMGTGTGTQKVTRGGGWINTRTTLWDRVAGAAVRSFAPPTMTWSGFRCAYSTTEEE